MAAAKLQQLGKLPSVDSLLPGALRSPFGKSLPSGESSGLSVGAVVVLEDKQYKIISRLASGGHSQVVRCADAEGFEYALKRTVCRSLRERAAAERELKILSELPRARGLVQLRSSAVKPGGSGGGGSGIEVFALLTLCRGGHLLGKLQRAGDELTDLEVWKCLQDVSEALAVLHGRGIVHWDLKLENILLSDEGTTGCQIADFGSATRVAAAAEEEEGGGGGGGGAAAAGGVLTLESVLEEQRRLQQDTTPAYLPPEAIRMLRDNEPVALTEKVDIWALGVIVYALHFGRLPFSALQPLNLEAQIRRGAAGLPELAAEEGQKSRRADDDSGDGGDGGDGGPDDGKESGAAEERRARQHQHRPMSPLMRRLVLRCFAEDPAERPSAAELAAVAAAALAAAVGSSWAAIAKSSSRDIELKQQQGPPATLALVKTQSASLHRLHRTLLEEAAGRAGGCADCCAETPRWAALDFSVWLCHRCARLHRWLLPGSWLQPVGSQRWTSDEVQAMCVDTVAINEEWEQIARDAGATNPRDSVRSSGKGPKHATERYDIERWILAKYLASFADQRAAGDAQQQQPPASPSQVSQRQAASRQPPPPTPPRLELVVDSNEEPEPERPGAALAGTSLIQKQGWLTLQQSTSGWGAVAGSKKRCWFVLTSECLAYFSSEAEGAAMADEHTFHASVRAKGVLDLGSVTDIRLVMDGESEAAGAAEFELCMVGRDGGRLVLRAENPAASLGWVKAVQNAVRQQVLLTPTSVPPTSPSRISDSSIPTGGDNHSDLSLTYADQEAEDLMDIMISSPVGGGDGGGGGGDDVLLVPALRLESAAALPLDSGSRTSPSVPRSQCSPSSLTARQSLQSEQVDRGFRAGCAAAAAVAGGGQQFLAANGLRAALAAGLGREVPEAAVAELRALLGLQDAEATVDRGGFGAAMAAFALGGGGTAGSPTAEAGCGDGGSNEPTPEEADSESAAAENQPGVRWLAAWDVMDPAGRGTVRCEDLAAALGISPGGAESAAEIFSAMAIEPGTKSITATHWATAANKLALATQHAICRSLAQL
eukprot:SAG22_NODE_137_length_18056_cov_9.974940_13_plen_1055_part_00